MNVFQSGERCGAWLIATVARDRCAANAQTSSSMTRHLGVMPAIAVGLIKMHQRRYYFRISYRSADNVSQVVVFEVLKHMPRMLQAVLMVRAPQTCNPRSVCAAGTAKAPLLREYASRNGFELVKRIY